MQAEKQNNKLGKAMDSLHELPEGFSFNSQRVWDHLENQLPHRRNERKIMWYAAASIVVVMGVGYFTWFNQKASTIIQEKNVAVVEKKSEPKIVEQNKPNTAIAITSITPTVHHQQKTNTKQTHKAVEEIKAFPSNTITAAVSADINTEVKPQPVAEQTNNTTIPAAEEKKKPVITAAKKSVARPYRIVHLNDLDAMPAPAQGTLSKSEFKKLMQQQSDDKEVDRSTEASPHPLLFLKKQVSTNTLSDNF